MFPTPHGRSACSPMLWLAAACLLCVSGCGADSDALPGRVAIEVSVTIGGTPAGDGNLVLRPDPGVKCPLIQVPVVGGIGRMTATMGPVPGSYQATFRSAAAGADMTEQLSASGRVAPTSGGGVSTPSASGTPGREVMIPKEPISITIPNANPAVVVAVFDAA